MKEFFTTIIIFFLLLPFAMTQNVGIGTVSPQAKLDVVGDALINGIKAGRGGGNLSNNTVFVLTA